MRASIDLTSLPTTDPLRLYRCRDGLYATDLLIAAVVHLDLFSWLAREPSTAAGIASHFGFQDRPVDVMLTLFTAMGLLECHDGRVHVSATGREHLTADSPWNLAGSFTPFRSRRGVHDYLEILKTDRPASLSERTEIDWQRAIKTQPFAESFIAMMDTRGRYLAPALASAVDVSSRSALLDIGGGSGVYACAIAARAPHLRATVLEQRPVDRIAAEAIATRGFSERVTVVTGDMFAGDLPSGHDVHLFSNALHDWGVTEVARLLAASRRGLPAGGLLVIHDEIINADKTGPLPVAEYSAMLMHTTGGKCYSIGEYRELLRAAGFEPGEYQDTVADRGVLLATAV